MKFEFYSCNGKSENLKFSMKCICHQEYCMYPKTVKTEKGSTKGTLQGKAFLIKKKI